MNPCRLPKNGEEWIMLKIKEYVKVNSLEEAYELNQKKSSRVLGGMVWMKMMNRSVGTAIDLSGLGLDTVKETEDEFVIGCMTSLRTLETHAGINTYTDGAVRESLRHIVGVQFRNCATVGGSIYGRFGFSDVLTMFLALDSYVELFGGGRISMEEFSKRKADRDILVNIIVKKHAQRSVYLSQRNASTDFPVLACAVCLDEEGMRLSIGARPGRAVLMKEAAETPVNNENMSPEEWNSQAELLAEKAAESITTGSNMRASKEYRTHLVRVLAKRALLAAGGMGNGN